MALFQTDIFFRGTTIIFLVTFKDQNGNVVQPPGGQVSITPPGGSVQTYPLIPPGGAGGDPVQWLGSWDSRGSNPGKVYWSIHSATPLPVTVADGFFQLNANQANLISF